MDRLEVSITVCRNSRCLLAATIIKLDVKQWATMVQIQKLISGLRGLQDFESHTLYHVWNLESLAAPGTHL